MNTTGRNVTEKLAFAILARIGGHRYSFFDEGVAEDSGIWYTCLRDETGGDTRAAARAITYLVKAGYLVKEADTQDSGSTDNWMALTTLGADTAKSMANEWAKEDIPEAPESSHNTASRSWTSHEDCGHPKTPKDRAACRKERRRNGQA